MDLANDTVADYNWITPNQFNDMHATLSAGYKGLTGDPAKISQGDDFLRQIVPIIMASNAYKNHGVIVIWFDESESDGVAGDNPDDFNHTIGEIIISPRAHKNVGGRPYASSVNYTHSSDLRTRISFTWGRISVMQPTRRICPICSIWAPFRRSRRLLVRFTA